MKRKARKSAETGVCVVCVSLLLCCASCLSSAPPSSDKSTQRRETGRCFLEGEGIEECGYGLYSYVLLGSAPSDANRDRYLKTIAAFLRFVPEIRDLRRGGIPQRALNVTYIPIVSRSEQTEATAAVIGAKGDSPLIDDLAKWVLRNYNYPRARAFLSAVPGGPHLDGPYFVSTLKPLTGIEIVTEQYLYQDLSSVPPDIVTPWIKAFISQASQEEFWEARNAEQFALKLREAIALLAEGASASNKAWPKARKLLASLIEWKK